ncbi:hypothetical protein PtrSN002B_010439 [Pyrenophora tritici-repentis]|nr:hypothetical protein PtrSN001A_010264 [Pyrenophora tritici-repentis]KAI1526281.1 hypothetical protein PtrSN001C_010293 [Pyrenophora tritici-repentis]KAI1533028.1 hypothetical protein PtrSN002B_010439 [Pyrenophora tritici-repentis]KAI1561858.1 hypothetical protein PtrEW4_010341 [Pyrenophora tritici-repentis]KAI1564491.1 hypothetical protein PtrEW7m1_010207 [Pyrenophora tritici-repentis]
MGALNLIPLIILFAVVGGIGWVGYQIYLYSNELAERGVKKMEKKNVVFTKDGAKVGVKEFSRIAPLVNSKTYQMIETHEME